MTVINGFRLISENGQSHGPAANGIPAVGDEDRAGSSMVSNVENGPSTSVNAGTPKRIVVDVHQHQRLLESTPVSAPSNNSRDLHSMPAFRALLQAATTAFEPEAIIAHSGMDEETLKGELSAVTQLDYPNYAFTSPRFYHRVQSKSE